MMIRKICITIVCLTLVYLAGMEFGFWGENQKAATNIGAHTIEKFDGQSQDSENTKKDISETQPTSDKTKASAAETQTVSKKQQKKQADNGIVGAAESISRPDTITGPMGTVEGPFVLIKLTLANHTSSTKHIVGFGIQLTDTDGNSYSLAQDAMGALFQKQMPVFHMEDISPGMQKNAWVVFAVPRTATPVAILVRPHGLSEKTYQINL